jgi:hypothetical protein
MSFGPGAGNVYLGNVLGSGMGCYTLHVALTVKTEL